MAVCNIELGKLWDYPVFFDAWVISWHDLLPGNRKRCAPQNGRSPDMPGKRSSYEDNPFLIKTGCVCGKTDFLAS